MLLIKGGSCVTAERVVSMLVTKGGSYVTDQGWFLCY